MANLLSNTTIGGYQSIHTGNIGSYALTSLPSHNHDDRYFTETESDGRFQPLENQRVSTSSTVRFSNTYTTAWFRNDNSNTGLYNESTTQHLSSNSNGYWDMSSTTSHSGIRFYTGGHVSALRGYIYANTSNEIGFLTNDGNWGLQVDSSKNVRVYGVSLTIGNTTSSDIYMVDTDEGNRRIHCNSGRVGFLSTSNTWGSWAASDGSWHSDQSMRAPIFYDSADTGYYLDPNGTTNIWRLQANDKYHYFGSSSNWDDGSLNGVNSNITNVHFQGHVDFWIGAGNTKWYTGAVSGHHDLLINTMQSGGSNTRGITFTASTNGGSVYRLGRWFSHSTQVGSYLNVDGSIKIGGTSDTYSLPAAKLQVISSTAGTDVVAVDGVNGRLFTVTDDLSDSLFSVNTIAGLPVIEAFADNTVKIGKYGSNSITISDSKIAINSDLVDSNFPFFVGDRSVAGARYSLTNKGMGFNLADNYAQLQLYGGNGSYIDFVTSSGQDSAGRIMWDGNFNIQGTTYFANNIYTYTLYDRNDTGYYLDMNSTSRLGTLNINQLSVYGNTYLGDGNGDEVHINDILRVGATDSGDAHFYFGEGGSAGSDYGSHWYWDAGYTFTWNTRNAGTDTALFNYITNDTTYVNWSRHFNMQNREVNYVSQLHFNGGTRFTNNGSNYLNFQVNSDSYGSIQVRDQNSVLKGYLGYFDANGFGLLNSSGSWGIRLNPGNGDTILYSGGNWKLTTISAGISVNGNVYTNQNFGDGLVGVYSSTRYQGVFAMGDAYKLSADGTSSGSLYGIAWTHTNVGGQSKSGLGHQALFMANGSTQTAIGYGIWTVGLITTTDYGTSANWNTAFGWGNHASAGYLTSLPSHNHDDRYYTESEIDSQIGNRLYQARVNGLNVNSFNATGIYRGSTSDWSNRPTITHNGGALLTIDTHPSEYHSQLFFDTGGDRLYFRNANGGSWGSWLIMFHTGNYTSYVPTLTGGGASGTWSINVTGSAGSVAWTNVSSRPTALSQFTNDLGNYGGFLTSITAHTHAISDVTGLQTALDGKQASGSYAASSHTHDDRYYTESESDTRFARKDTDAAISGNLVIGNGTYSNSTAYGNSGARLMFSGSDGDAQGNYYIGTNHNDYGGNYSKLELRWHTGIRMGAQPGYGGIRFYDTEDLGTVIFSVGTGDSHVRVVNNLYVGGNLALHAGNYNSYSPTLTGTGASGTWGISVSGNAATATNVAYSGLTGTVPTWNQNTTGSAGSVGGYAVSGSVGANTVVIRDANGYIYANYINSNVSETENPTINSFYTSNGDGWLRKSSVAHVKSQLGLGSMAYESSGTYQTVSGAINTGNIASQSVSYATISQQLTKFGDIYGQDWNSYFITAKLIVSNALGHTGANRPSDSYGYGTVLSYGETGGPLMQMYFPEDVANTGGAYRALAYRSGYNGSWSAWKTVVNQVGNTCTVAGSNGTGLQVHSNVGYNQNPLTYFLLRGQADSSWKTFKILLTGDAGGQDIEFRRIAENSTDARMFYVPRGLNQVIFDYTVVQPSDSRLKDNLTPITTPVEKIKSLRGVEFDWNSGEHVGTHDVGLIAQDVEAVLPEAVTTQEDGYKNLAYTKVIPLLVEAMKEQQAMIEALRAEVELLKNK
jgi:hypothetical protein